ncbi:hypothetical protein E2562_022994 [Oryza meyeriana var. granulata]|uniref:Uncharacterized protein n=1 Tax=Oryza meyeriana var. granulata TaxID=110450 RepID=A0A6G1EYC0_9ORYZ|nr:hypothetical protein E2562_022994 [Oryza meyeriana var. granulata]
MSRALITGVLASLTKLSSGCSLSGVPGRSGSKMEGAFDAPRILHFDDDKVKNMLYEANREDLAYDKLELEKDKLKQTKLLFCKALVLGSGGPYIWP